MRGITPPPTTIVINIPDAAAVYLPKPSTARLNIPPHMTDVQRPQRTINRHFTGTSNIAKPSAALYPGIDIWRFAGRNMAISNNIMAVAATVIICALVDT